MVGDGVRRRGLPDRQDVRVRGDTNETVVAGGAGGDDPGDQGAMMVAVMQTVAVVGDVITRSAQMRQPHVRLHTGIDNADGHTLPSGEVVELIDAKRFMGGDGVKLRVVEHRAGGAFGLLLHLHPRVGVVLRRRWTVTAGVEVVRFCRHSGDRKRYRL